LKIPDGHSPVIAVLSTVPDKSSKKKVSVVSTEGFCLLSVYFLAGRFNVLYTHRAAFTSADDASRCQLSGPVYCVLGLEAGSPGIGGAVTTVA
jgi:hypothetical protein